LLGGLSGSLNGSSTDVTRGEAYLASAKTIVQS
jgi:hypothetical protein